MSIEFYYASKHTEVTVETRNEAIGDLVEDFKTFLLAVGYHPKSVARAFNEEEDT